MRFFFTFTRTALRLLGVRLAMLVFLTGTATLTEGLGVSLFLPLLQGTETDSTLNKAMNRIFEAIDLPFEFRFILIAMVLFFFLKNVLLLAQDTYVARILSHLLVDLRCSLARRLFQAEYQYLITKSAGYLNNAITREFELVTLAFKMYASILVQMLSIVLYLLLPALINVWITGIVILLGIPLAFSMKKINALTKRYSLQSVRHGAGLHGFLIQAMSFIKYLKSTAGHPAVLEKIENESEQLGKLRFRANVLEAITRYAFEPFAILALALLLFYHIEILGQDILEIAFLIFLLRRAMSGVLTLQQHFRKFLSTYGSVGVFNELDTELSENAESLPAEGLLPDFSQPLKFHNVTFAYASEAPVIRNISFVIPSCTTIAFVGESGSGKSTIVNLLTGILCPTEGHITLGEIPYDALDRHQLRRRTGYITQENVIFNDTIRNNITLWDPSISEDRMQEASQQARIHEFIQSLPNGYNTRLGDGGINISGGQRQRIMIARELYKQSSLLIFDESTSALDTSTEREIQRNIDAFKGKKTIVLIAHRLSTVQNADQILVLKQGKIVGQGTYAELYQNNAEFQRMVNEQTYATT